VQVNVSGEASKHERPGTALDLARRVANLPGLRLRGFMAIPEAGPDTHIPVFRSCALCWSSRAEGLPVDTLSMGMSADLESAILEGSTMVRVGSALFGARRTPHSAARTRMKPMKLGFIGGGNMAAAMIGGLVQKALRNRTSSSRNTRESGVPGWHASLPLPRRRKRRRGSASERDRAGGQPQQLRAALCCLPTLREEQLVVSIAAGVRAADISRWLEGHAP